MSDLKLFVCTNFFLQCRLPQILSHHSSWVVAKVHIFSASHLPWARMRCLGKCVICGIADLKISVLVGWYLQDGEPDAIKPLQARRKRKLIQGTQCDPVHSDWGQRIVRSSHMWGFGHLDQVDETFPKPTVKVPRCPGGGGGSQLLHSFFPIPGKVPTAWVPYRPTAQV